MRSLYGVASGPSCQPVFWAKLGEEVLKHNYPVC